MELEILRLGSVVKYGVGGPGVAAINLIYTYLLQRHSVNYYRFIAINQIGDDLDEVIIKSGPKDIHINVRHPATPNFDSLPQEQKNLIRLEIIHTAMERLSDYDSRIRVDLLETIKGEILASHFHFLITYKEFINKTDPTLTAKLVIEPGEYRFNFYTVFERNGIEFWRQLVYSGIPNVFYVEALFSTGKWKSVNHLLISGKSPDVEIHLLVDKQQIELINKSNYKKAPFFAMMQFDTSTDEKRIAYEDWLHSLPPAIAAIVEQTDN